ncbi:MAG: hypothetical protein ACREIC_16125, partial [Limisphaerales bacterium]
NTNSTMSNSPILRTSTSPPMVVRVCLEDGSIESFVQTEEATARKLWDAIDPVRLFTQPRVVIAGTHSKSVFVGAAIVRIDFVQHFCPCWQFPEGYADIVELSEEDFRKNAHLDQPELMQKREQPTAVGDLLVSFLQLKFRNTPPLFLMAELSVKLPVENQSFMRFLLSKTGFHMRLRGGGVGVINLAQLVGYTVYPGVAQVPADSWDAEPVSTA